MFFKETDLVFLLWCMRLIICMHYFWCRYYIPWFETRKHFAPSRWAHCADWFWPLIFDFVETPCKLRKHILSAVKTFLEYLTDSLSADELINTYRIWNILKIKSKNSSYSSNHLWLFTSIVFKVNITDCLIVKKILCRLVLFWPRLKPGLDRLFNKKRPQPATYSA